MLNLKAAIAKSYYRGFTFSRRFFSFGYFYFWPGMGYDRLNSGTG